MADKKHTPDRIVGHARLSLRGRTAEGKQYKVDKVVPVYRVKGPMPNTPEYEKLIRALKSRRAQLQAPKQRRKAS